MGTIRRKMTKEEAKKLAINIFNHIWHEKSKQALLNWLKLTFSFKGVTCFLPGIIGVLFVYWAQANGFQHQLLGKGENEDLALWLMGTVTALFLLRLLIYKLKVDVVLLIVAVAFLCREIHFPGTDAGVVIATIIAALLALYWEDELINVLEKAKWFQICMTGTMFTYLVAILIQKRVFKPYRIPILPHENAMHIPLEEVLENFAHAYFIVTAIVAFFSIKAIVSNHKNSGTAES